ncbi:MAG: ATP-binding protein [Alphaproteobacteria bacterium]|nr:MAG: ATP-binding protein [Alphaproteobacteria bacterium]
MLFLVGPRQVGKTTIAKNCQKSFKESIYLNYDIIKDRNKILSGQDFIEDIFPLSILREKKPLIIFDEIHKYKDWKNYLKGFYDQYNKDYHILVTGSARLDIYKSGGDSLMGRYFQYRIHPLSTREILDPATEIIQPPKKIDSTNWSNLYKFGGFPNPFLQNNQSFSNKWQNLKHRQLFFDDIQSISAIKDIQQMEVLSELLRYQAGQLLNRTNLAKKIQTTAQTVGRWVDILERFYFCFSVKPWHKNIARSLIKESKLYMWDWSIVESEGAKFENFLASHLLKAVHLWEDLGKGAFELFYIRDKHKKEVDFLVTKNKMPWLLVEAKLNGNERLSSNLLYFQNQIHAEHVLQVAFNVDYVNKSCFEVNTPLVVPAKTFLSELV